jgi:prepilin-type N-terminal cleavage/methylation domain-containing protein
MNSKRRNGQSGFTLIEVMFALLIFIVALVGLVGLQRVSNTGAFRGKQHTAAVNVARTFLTQLQLEVGNWWDDFNNFNVPAGQFPLLTPAVVAPDTWINIHTEADFRVGEFLGHSAMASSDNYEYANFCVNYMVSPLENRPVGQMNNAGVTVWKVRVRVSWTKRSRYGGPTGDNADYWKSCAPTDVAQRLTDGADEAIEIVGAATRELAG